MKLEKIYAKAKEFLGKACDMGHVMGCKNYKILNMAIDK